MSRQQDNKRMRMIREAEKRNDRRDSRRFMKALKDDEQLLQDGADLEAFEKRGSSRCDSPRKG